MGTKTLTSSAYDGRRLQLVCTQVSNGSEANSSTIKWTLTSYGGNVDYYDVGPTTVKIAGKQVYSKARQSWNSHKFPASKGSVSGTVTVDHNNDGTKTIPVQFSTAIYVGTVSTYKDNNWVLDPIPRYGTCTQKFVSKTETSITMEWSSDSTVDKVWYSVDNGTTWTELETTEANTGTYTINNLSYNTNYQVKTRIRRKDSQLTTDSSMVEVLTYNYPHCTSTPNFIVGEKLTLNFYNPLHREITVKVIGADSSILSTDIITTDSLTGFITTNFINNAYLSLPNSMSGEYKVSVTYGESVRTRTNHNRYTLNANDCKPTFNDFTYLDTNTAVTNVTGNNQVLVKGKSTLQVNISTANKMVAQKGASPNKYVANMDTLNASANYSSNSNISLNLGAVTDTGTKRLNVTAYDSRNNGTTIYKDIMVYDYAKPTINIDVSRLNNFENQTTLKVSGTYTELNIKGYIKNSIQSVQYRYRETGGTWSSWVTLKTTLTDGKFTCNDTLLSLDNTKSFEFEIKATDKLDSSTETGIVNEGEAIFFICTNLKKCYINDDEILTYDIVEEW